MHVRLSRFTGLAPNRFEEVVAAYEESDYLDRLSALEGFAGYVLAGGVGATDQGKLTAMSLWRTRDDLDASDELADAARGLRIASARPARPPIVRRYEVLLHRGLGPSAPHLRLSRVSGIAPGAVDAMVEAYEGGRYLDELAEAPDFGGYLLLASEGRDEVTAVSSWTSRAGLLSTDHIADAARAARLQAARTGDEPIVDRYEVLLQRHSAAPIS